MTKSEFLELFAIEDVVNKNIKRIPLLYTLSDILHASKTVVSFAILKDNIITISITSSDFNKELSEFQLYLTINENIIKLHETQELINDIFPMLNFKDDLDLSLKFIAQIINEILRPKYELKGSVLTDLY